MSPDPIGWTLGLAPTAAEKVGAFRDRDEVRNLFDLLDKELRACAKLPPGSREQVCKAVHDLKLDPKARGALEGLLEGSDPGARGAWRRVLSQSLTFDDDTIEVSTVADVVVAVTEANLHRAKRDEREAAHFEGDLTRRRLESLAGGIAGLSELLEGPRADLLASGTARNPPGAAQPHGYGRRLGSELAWLAGLDADGADHLAEALQGGGAARLAQLVDHPQPWLESAAPAVWEALGGMLSALSEYGAAERAFVRAADHPGVGDRGRDLARAALAADGHGAVERRDQLLATATQLGPDNPGVLLAQAQSGSLSPHEAGELLDRVQPRDDRQRTQLQIQRAINRAIRQDFAGARRALDDVPPDSPNRAGVEEVGAVIALVEAQHALSKARDPDLRPIREAGDTLARLAREAREEGRHVHADVFTGKAVQSLALAGETTRAGALLDGLPERDRDDQGAVAIAQGAMLLKRFDVVRVVSAHSTSSELRLLRAEVEILDQSGARHQAVQELDLLMEDPELRVRAAFARLAAWERDSDVAWSEAAEQVVNHDRPWVVAMLRAEHHVQAGDVDEARRLLTPHNTLVPVLRFLVSLAANDGSLEEALRLSGELLHRTRDGDDRGRHAVLLRRAGQTEAARREILLVARDSSLGVDDRSNAYRSATSALLEDEEFAALEGVAREWRELCSQESDAAWLELFALGRQTRFTLAMARWRELEPPVTQLQQALLVGELFSQAAAPLEAVAKLAQLSDDFGRPEALEFNLIVAVLRLEKDPAGPQLEGELATRVSEAYATFPERFPDSQLLEQVAIDKDDLVGSFARELRQRLGPGQDDRRSALEAILDGTGAVCVLAAVTGKPIGETWLRLPALPLGYGAAEVGRLERSAAATAVTAHGAVWAPSALFMAGGLGGELTQRLRGALPASMIAQATLDEVSQAHNTPASDERTEIGYDADADAVAIIDWPAADVARDRARASGMLAMARDLTVRPDQGPTVDDRLDELQQHGRDTALLPWIASLSVASREGLAFYSDDRYERAAARQLGLQAFGTLALLDALADRGDLPAQLRTDARRVLLNSAALGAKPSGTELVELARDSQWRLIPGLAALLRDKAAWHGALHAQFEACLDLLAACATEDPDRLDRWVARVIDGASEALGLKWSTTARPLMAMVLNPAHGRDELTDEVAAQLLSAILEQRYFKLYRPPDLLVLAVADILSIVSDEAPQLRGYFFKRMLARVPAPRHLPILQTFVRRAGRP